MIVVLKDCHFEALLRSGYKQYGLNKYQFIKNIDPNNEFEKKLQSNAYFHAIVSYSNSSISIHIDTPKKFHGHWTTQKSPAIQREIARIKKTTITYKLEQVKLKYINKLKSKYEKINKRTRTT